jgi:hypothetical protein
MKMTHHHVSQFSRIRPFHRFCALLLAIAVTPWAIAEDSAIKDPPPETRPAEASVDVAKRIDPTDFKHRFDLRSEYVDYGTASTYAITPRGEYAFTNALAFRVELPVAQYDPGAGAASDQGIGNLLTRLAWRAVRGDGYAMVVGSELTLNTASDATLGNGKNVIAPLVFWSIDIPKAKSVFFPFVQYGRSYSGETSREAVHYTNLRTSLLTRWPSKVYSFIEVSYWFDHERSNSYSSNIKAEVGRFFTPKTGLYIRPGTGMSGTDNRLGVKSTIEIGMRHFF